jgi:hypothetical protein
MDEVTPTVAPAAAASTLLAATGVVAAPAAPVAAAAPASVEAAPPAVAAPEAITPVAAAPVADAAAAPAEGAPAAPLDTTIAAEPAPAEAPVVESPKYAETLKVPEYLKVAPDQMGAFSEILSEIKATPEQAQKLMDFGGGFIKSASEAMDQRQRDVFTETRAGWVKDSQKKFGNRFDTVVNDAKAAIAAAVPNAKARAELWSVLAYTGAGDHPAVIGAFAELNRRLTERGAPGKGLPATSAKTGSAADRRYGRPPQS